ncbi:hypothetical protein F4778DRAFT_786978 [Xylariomycetidae sp. FL2044]|nr:hypothetical protein F4778DRAFT_786978 [Xylariomycetidae sp. FL2044]
MSASSQSNSAASSAGMVDPLELLDFSEYDSLPYQSPSVSPATTNKPQFARPPTAMSATPSTMPPSQPMSGPSHQYDQYKQQTPFVPGAFASTIAANESNPHLHGGYNLEYMNPQSDELFDFNAPPTQSSMDIDFESSPDTQYFFGGPTVNPQSIDGIPSPTVPSQTSSVGRMYPGMHQQAALAKAQAQQRQQQQIIQQQQQERQNQQGKQNRSKVPMPADPFVEQKITQLLNSMRSRPSEEDGMDNSPLLQIPKLRKEEDDMDEDERLLASEEGKKLSSKERRQLRNKVSARAFRSRRKEYITQLESEIANKVTENGELRAQNRTLMEENRRLSDLTRMLLASPSFSNFLDHLSSNPQAMPRNQTPQVEQRQPEQRQTRKDVNSYTAQQAQQQQQQQQIGMVLMPEQTMDFSMLNINSDFNYRPQVFSVLETPEVNLIDAEVLAGKVSTLTEELVPRDSEKVDAPVVEAPPTVEKSQTPEAPVEMTPSERTVADLDGDIFDDDTTIAAKPLELDTENLSNLDIFGGIETDKVFARYELVDASDEEATASVALRRVERLSASLEATLSRLDRLTIGL